jgi:hypothetical protein
MSDFEVPTPILNTPFEKPEEYRIICDGESPQWRVGIKVLII